LAYLGAKPKSSKGQYNDTAIPAFWCTRSFDFNRQDPKDSSSNHYCLISRLNSAESNVNPINNTRCAERVNISVWEQMWATLCIFFVVVHRKWKECDVELWICLQAEYHNGVRLPMIWIPFASCQQLSRAYKHMTFIFNMSDLKVKEDNFYHTRQSFNELTFFIRNLLQWNSSWICKKSATVFMNSKTNQRQLYILIFMAIKRLLRKEWN